MLRDKYKHGLKYFRLYDGEGKMKLENVKGCRGKGNGHAEGLWCDTPRKEPKERKKTKNSVIVFPCERIEDILIPPDLHKSSVICYRLNKIIFTERRSKSKKKR